MDRVSVSKDARSFFRQKLEGKHSSRSSRRETDLHLAPKGAPNHPTIHLRISWYYFQRHFSLLWCRFLPKKDALIPTPKATSRVILVIRSIPNLLSLSCQHGVWKSQKKSHLRLRAKRATFTFWVDKNKLKMIHSGEFCGHTVLPDRLILIGQKLVENAKIQMRHFVEFSNNVNVY